MNFCLEVCYCVLYIKRHQFYVKYRTTKSHLRVYKKSATVVETNGRIATDGPLYTGIKMVRNEIDKNIFTHFDKLCGHIIDLTTFDYI